MKVYVPIYDWHYEARHILGVFSEFPKAVARVEEYIAATNRPWERCAQDGWRAGKYGSEDIEIYELELDVAAEA